MAKTEKTTMRDPLRWLLVLVAVLLAGWVFFLLCGSSNSPVSIVSQPHIARVTAKAPDQPKPQLPTPIVRTRWIGTVRNGPIGIVTGGGERISTNYLGRMAALHQLPSVLSTNDAALLHLWLTVPYDSTCGLTAIEFNGLKNAAADLLMQQPVVSAEWIVDFAAMFLDTTYDPVWRDYCLQFLSVGHEKLTGRTDGKSVETRATVLAVLREATKLRTDTFAGTALLGLNAIARHNPETVKLSEIAAIATAVVQDERTSEPCRITALRVSALLNVTDVLPVARELAQTGETEMLRQVAVATIGDLGSAVDLELLEALSRDSDQFVAATAAQTVDTLRNRMTTKLNTPNVGRK